MLYNEADRTDNNKIAGVIRNMFKQSQYNVEGLEEFYYYLKLQDMLDFSGVDFNKAIKTTRTRDTSLKTGMTGYKLSSSDFDISIGNRVLSTEIVQDGMYPVYSANVYEEFGRINKQNITDFSKPSIIWGIDGDWMVNYIPANKPFYPTDHCGVIRINTDEILPQYLAIALQIEGEYEKFSRSNRASTQRIKNLILQIPEKEIQQNIIDEISVIDERIRKEEATISELSNDVKSKFVEMFGDKKWNQKHLKQISKDIFAGGDKPEDYSEVKTEEYPYPVYSNGEKNGGLLCFSKACRVKEKALTISARGTIGYTCVREGNFTPVVRLITMIPSEEVNIQYLKHCIDNLNIVKTGSGAGQLTIPEFAKLTIDVPPIQLQNEFANYVKIIDKLKFTRCSVHINTKCLRKDTCMKTIEEKIKDVDNSICEFIDLIEVSSRGRMSDAILKHLRDLVEHIAVKIYAENHPAHINYDCIPLALEYLKTSYEFYFLRKFHGFLQESSSHYTHDPEGAERLMLKYYEYLLQIKVFVLQRYNMEILRNIEKFPVDLDDTMQQYYEKIVEKLNVPRYAGDFEKTSERFYVQKSKPFFVHNQVYYESTLIPANDETSKFNRLVVFSKFKIYTNYAIKVSVSDDIIEISGKFMPVKILTAWNSSIRPCELNNFAKVVGEDISISGKHAEYIGLMNYLAQTGLNLVEILSFSNNEYEKFKTIISERARVSSLTQMLDKAREWIICEKRGSNVVRYLLYSLNNKIIKLQLSDEENYRMKGLYLDNKSIPFDEMPYNSSLYNHNPSIIDLFGCIKLEGREYELLAHRIGVNADTYGKLYTKRDELEGFDNIDLLVELYNRKLYVKHQHRRIERFGQNLIIKGYENDTKEIVEKLISYTEAGIDDYRASVEGWLAENPNTIDCDEKKEILLNMFEESSVAMIYGAAGTGKSTLIKHISQFWEDSNKVYIANTHPAVENLRRKVKDGTGAYLTIKKFIHSYPQSREIDILFIDECSMVSNRDMVEVLKKGNFKLLVLVGDIYQIESIQFGNWFSLARYFVPLKSQYELTKPYRTDDKYLLELWERVRNYKDNVEEWLGQCNYVTKLDESIFEAASEDEIVLCLNYDGLYGINNINRFLQNANPSTSFQLGVWTYKVGDPILFNDSSKYDSVLYNNLKGKIVNIEEDEEKILFSVEIDKVLNGMQVAGTGLELLPKQTIGKSVVRFPVKKKKVGDDDNDDYDLETNVPFQIAYAVSIHKAQGLEYKSVKIVITKEIDELITHNIFYTAITRAKENLKIYWTAESQKKILESFVDDETLNDAKIFEARTGLKIIKRK